MALTLPSRLLIHRALIERVREIPTMLGGEQKTYEELEADVPCRFMQGPQNNDVNLGGIEVGQATGAVYFAWDQVVGRDDRITVEGIQLLVLGAGNPSERTAYKKAFVREQQVGETL